MTTASVTKSATNVPIPNEFDDENDFFTHPLCKTYESNRFGVVRHIKSKNQVGYRDKRGYFRFGCNGSCCCRGKKKSKNYFVHRFVYESFWGLIEDGKVIDHINNIHSDNRLENLQKITQKENSKKNARKGFLPSIRVKPINIDTGEMFIYKSIRGASKDLGVNNRSISFVLSGLQNTAKSKKYGEIYTFQKIDKDTENKSTIIIVKNKINIPIEQVKKMIVNNSS